MDEVSYIDQIIAKLNFIKKVGIIETVVSIVESSALIIKDT